VSDDVGHVILRSVDGEERLEDLLVKTTLIRILSRTKATSELSNRNGWYGIHTGWQQDEQ
jgi:hypothetical protein